MNWQQVRAKIERGESGDKIGGFDPAAAPLGTDDGGAHASGRGGCEPRRRPVRRHQFRRH